MVKMNGEMSDFLVRESLGGNAGSEEIDGKNYLAGAANGYANIKTGEIGEFSNYPLKSEFAANFGKVTFRVLVDYDPAVMAGKGFFKINNTFFRANFSPEAKAAIEASVDEYNREHA